MAFVSRIHVRLKYSRSNCLFYSCYSHSLNHRCSHRVHLWGWELPKKYWAGRAWLVNLGGRLYSRKIMCRIQWHFRSNLQTSLSVWLFKEYDFVLADLNISVFTTLCCNVVAKTGDLTLSITELLNVRSPIWKYQFLQHFSVISTIWPYQLLATLLSDRRSDANTILWLMRPGNYVYR